MNVDLYIIIADLMRYVFILIVAFILLRLFMLSLKEWRVGAVTKKRRHRLEIGYISILSPKALRKKQYILYRETAIGRSRSCNVTLPVKTVKSKHAVIFERGGEIFITACYPERYAVIVDGEEIGRSDGHIENGSTVEMGDVSFRVFLNDEEDDGDMGDEWLPGYDQRDDDDPFASEWYEDEEIDD